MPALVIAVAALLYLALSANAQNFGPTAGSFRWADSSQHTWLDSQASGSAGEAEWENHFENSMNQDLAPTDMSEVEVTYHYNSGLTYPYVDVSWWATTSIYPLSGSAVCDKVVAGDNTRCDHWHVRFYLGSSGNENFHDHVACQEIGHTTGLDHSNEIASCMRNDSLSHYFSDHDRWHINGRY
jgi:hypothetical protein